MNPDSEPLCTSGHGNLKNLEIYTRLSLENVQRKYEEAMEGVGV